VLAQGGLRRRIRGVGTRGATRVDGSDCGLVEDARLDAGRGELFTRKGPAIHIGGFQFGSVHVDESELVPPGLASEPSRVVDRYLFTLEQPDPPAEIGLGAVAWRESENSRPLEEEIAPLWETKRETGEVETPLIDLRFREVGVHAHPRPQARRDVVIDVETDVARVRGLIKL
jgi:hypothetical protein